MGLSGSLRVPTWHGRLDRALLLGRILQPWMDLIVAVEIPRRDRSGGMISA